VTRRRLLPNLSPPFKPASLGLSIVKFSFCYLIVALSASCVMLFFGLPWSHLPLPCQSFLSKVLHSFHIYIYVKYPHHPPPTPIHPDLQSRITTTHTLLCRLIFHTALLTGSRCNQPYHSFIIVIIITVTMALLPPSIHTIIRTRTRAVRQIVSFSIIFLGHVVKVVLHPMH
jgi:hypothetical protein